MGFVVDDLHTCYGHCVRLALFHSRNLLCGLILVLGWSLLRICLRLVLIILLFRFTDDIHNLLLKHVLISSQSVLLPCIVVDAWVESVSLHTFFKKFNAEIVIRPLFEFQCSAVFHELFEFLRVTFAQLIKGSFNLLFLDILILI